MRAHLPAAGSSWLSSSSLPFRWSLAPWFSWSSWRWFECSTGRSHQAVSHLRSLGSAVGGQDRGYSETRPPTTTPFTCIEVGDPWYRTARPKRSKHLTGESGRMSFMGGVRARGVEGPTTPGRASKLVVLKVLSPDEFNTCDQGRREQRESM